MGVVVTISLCSIRFYRHIDYCMHRINLLRHYGVKPVLVFDGGLLPMKNEQEIKRARYAKHQLTCINDVWLCPNIFLYW